MYSLLADLVDALTGRSCLSKYFSIVSHVICQLGFTSSRRRILKGILATVYRVLLLAKRVSGQNLQGRSPLIGCEK